MLSNYNSLFNYKELSLKEIYKVIGKSFRCNFSTSKNNIPYTVPMYYSYCIKDDKLTMYMLSDASGKKMNNAYSNGHVCIEVVHEVKNYCNLEQRLIETVIAQGVIKSIGVVSSNDLVVKEILSSCTRSSNAKYLSSKKNLVLLTIKIYNIKGRAFLE